MNRVVMPLRAMGADITFLEEPGRLPLRVAGAALRGCHHDLAVPSAQVKSALLLAGLHAAGRTTIAGSGGSRDHTERMLQTMGLTCATGDPAYGPAGTVGLDGGARLRAFSLQVPGDPSTAAFFQVAAALVPGSDLLTTGLSLNPTRTGALQVLRRAGAQVDITTTGGTAAGEPVGDVRVRWAPPQPFAIGGEEVPALVDEIPVLSVLATAAAGMTRIAGAAELRVKESDRLALMAVNLAKLGARVVELPDGLCITGPTRLQGGSRAAPLNLCTEGDHRIAMALAVAALVSDGDSTLDDFDCVAVSFPQFFAVLAALVDDGISDRPF
jgi:3-phosphoshikimate 1-carboxyvinyltransferase